MRPLTRRAILGRGLAGAGALVVPGSLVGAATAQAQEDDQTDALEELVELEQAAELAYSLAVEEGDLASDVTSAFEEFSIHSEDHATAFSEALEQLAVEPPDASSEPDDYESLEDFDPSADENAVLEFMIELESGLVGSYEDKQNDLDDADLVRSAAQIGAAHAQQLVALRVLANDRNLVELPPPATADTESVPPDDTGSSGE